MQDEQSEEEKNIVVPFIQKLNMYSVTKYRMLSDDTQDTIVWGKNGESIIIKNSTEFTKTVLPQYFRHNQLASFIRQLNKHGFRRSKSTFPNSGDHSSEYSHQYFKRAKKDQWSKIGWNLNPKTGFVTLIFDTRHGTDVTRQIETLRAINAELDSKVAETEARCCLIEENMYAMRQTILRQTQMITQLVYLLPEHAKPKFLVDQFQEFAEKEPTLKNDSPKAPSVWERPTPTVVETGSNSSTKTRSSIPSLLEDRSVSPNVSQYAETPR